MGWGGRTTGRGLACPDWPLCEGRFIPRAEPHVLIEWSHRTVALLVIGFLSASVTDVAKNSTFFINAGGGVGLATAIVAWYASFAGVTNSTFKRVVLPVFPR
mgnify:CR=1 FL=1